MKQKYRFKVDKLVRDKLPEIIRSRGAEISEYIMEQDEYIQRLKNKLLEESEEVLDAQNLVELKEELADVLEVIASIAKAHDISLDEIRNIQEQKKLEKGGFDKRIYCSFVEIDAIHKEVIDGYRKQPEKYPEVECE
jgi:predicted house-cleaning noncanonical NTP pyrophosphatase (MazG superfamily)